MGFRPQPENKLNLQYNERNLVKKIELPTQLAGFEKEILKQQIEQEKKNYQDHADARFDSKKNWSIMITDECNDERNQIMRRFKFQQLKKHKLSEFTRVQRDKIIKDRENVQQAKDEDDGQDTMGRPSTSATTALGPDPIPNLKELKDEALAK